jgi:hypothetical protein
MTPDPPFGEVCETHPTGCQRCGGAITGRRIRWCSDACRLWYYKHHVWRYARRESMRRAKRTCVRCGKPAQEVDHIIERKGRPLSEWSCLNHQVQLRPLCLVCHRTRKKWEPVAPTYM